MISGPIPKQPNPVISYLRVGKLLYYSLILFILEAWVYWIQLEKAYAKGIDVVTVFWFVFFLFSFSHIYLVIMDGWSRFQNYKRAKDQFFIHGFEPRIVIRYMGSKCQRSAAIVAADELGMKSQVTDYYQKQGVKWFHYVPYFMVLEPLFLFKKVFWSRTFLEKYYAPKFDYRNPQIQFAL